MLDLPLNFFVPAYPILFLSGTIFLLILLAIHYFNLKVSGIVTLYNLYHFFVFCFHFFLPFQLYLHYVHMYTPCFESYNENNKNYYFVHFCYSFISTFCHPGTMCMETKLLDTYLIVEVVFGTHQNYVICVSSKWCKWSRAFFTSTLFEYKTKV